MDFSYDGTFDPMTSIQSQDQVRMILNLATSTLPAYLTFPAVYGLSLRL